MAHWNEKCSISKVFAQGSTLPVFSFFFYQFIFLKTFRAQPLVSSRLSLKFRKNSSKILGSLALTTPVPIAVTIFWDITVPAKCNPIITCIISSVLKKKTFYWNKVSIFGFKCPSKKCRRQKVTKYLGSDENFYQRIFLLTNF